MTEFSTQLLDSVKTTLRQAGSKTVFDDEIKDYIETCATDLQTAGISPDYFIVSDAKDAKKWKCDPQIKQAVRWYCLATFGLYNEDMEKYMNAYASLKATLATQSKYTAPRS